MPIRAQRSLLVTFVRPCPRRAKNYQPSASDTALPIPEQIQQPEKTKPHRKNRYQDKARYDQRSAHEKRPPASIPEFSSFIDESNRVGCPGEAFHVPKKHTPEQWRFQEAEPKKGELYT